MLSSLPVRAGEDQGEFFAANPGGDVIAPSRKALEHVGERLQSFIASPMPLSIVDRFEMVEVDQQE